MSCLYLISVPIGNKEDYSLRAKEVISKAQLIIGEEFKETSKFLKSLGLEKRDFELYNEHSSEIEVRELAEKVKNSSQSVLLPDAGSPGIEDPGRSLVNICRSMGVSIRVIPGPSALTAALSLSGFSVRPFTFIGFLNRDDKKREEELLQYLKLKHTLVLYETPYRYKKVLKELGRLAKRDLKVFLGLSLTSEEEFQYIGNLKSLLPQLESLPKAPPVIVIDNS
ncbi:MAG: 16S rRNA methyltransferase [Leptospiraceae bacterium]|nr:16S rRNA methyltransferase [Leptospiraceae bacterium]MCP5500915.1 16S rRNA methyltransferase [Leptospiraceae bacterium]